MKILWIHQYFATPKGWGSLRQYAFSRRWVEAKHSVDVVCCAAYDSSLTGVGRGVDVIDGIRLHVRGADYKPQMTFIRRVCSFLHFMLHSLWFVTRYGGGYDVIITSSGPLTNLLPALWGRLLHRVPYVFEVLDVWPDAAIQAGVLRSRLLQWLSFRLEALGYRHASQIVTCSTGMTARVRAKMAATPEGMVADSDAYKLFLASVATDTGKVTTVAHGADLEHKNGKAFRQRVCQEQGWPEDVCIVLYMGAMGLSNAIPDVVDAMSRTTDDPRLVWVFAGSGKEEWRIQRQLGQARGLFLGKMQHDRMLEVCAAADVNVVTFMHEPLFYENSPNKFFDGIAAGLPTVFNRTTWLEPWLKEYGCGIVCTGENAGAEMAQQLKLLAADGELRSRMGKGARRLAEEVFSRDTLAAEYLELLRKVAR
jgi:glycosyltransferase involved in cell wall biosynthesis